MTEDQTYAGTLETHLRDLQVIKASPFPGALLEATANMRVALNKTGANEWGQIVTSLFTDDVRKKLMAVVECRGRSWLALLNAGALEEYRETANKLRSIRERYADLPPTIETKKEGLSDRLLRVVLGKKDKRPPAEPLWSLFREICPYFSYAMDLKGIKEMIRSSDSNPEAAKAELLRLLDICLLHNDERIQWCVDRGTGGVSNSSDAVSGTGEMDTANP